MCFEPVAARGPVRLRVGVLAWPAHGPDDDAPPGPRFLSIDDELWLISTHARSATVCDAAGTRYRVPRGFVTPSHAGEGSDDSRE